MQIAERQILATLRDQRFFSVVELNAAMAPLLAQLNAKVFQKLDGSRDSWFESLENPRLLPLPPEPFDLAVWSKAKVNIDYHVVVETGGGASWGSKPAATARSPAQINGARTL